MSERSQLPYTAPFEHRALPERHDVAHAVAFHFHDVLVTLVKDLESAGAFHVQLTPTQAQLEELTPLQGEALWEWLETNGYHDVVEDLNYRQLTAALIADVCHFVFESLSACAKGKTAVAFTLLRKPFKENLLLLEWLCAQPDDFLNAFRGSSVWAYAPNKLPKEKRQEIIEGAVEVIGEPRIVDPEFLWEIRYSKRKAYSLEQLWTKSTHLVTTVDEVKTETGNLDFVFSQLSAIEEQWDMYYRVVPLLLAYTVRVVEAVVDRLVVWDEDKHELQEQLRALAFLRYSETASSSPSAPAQVDELLRYLDETLVLPCRKCVERIQITRANADRLWSSALLQCSSCGELLDVWEELFGEAEAPARGEEE